jgi:EAL domain-containing protein (putative c-di-GMP-specific phosphodiesterase class I)
MRSLGCDQVQGFLFSAPLPAEQASSLLNTPWGMRTTPAPTAQD